MNSLTSNQKYYAISLEDAYDYLSREIALYIKNKSDLHEIFELAINACLNKNVDYENTINKIIFSLQTVGMQAYQAIELCDMLVTKIANKIDHELPQQMMGVMTHSLLSVKQINNSDVLLCMKK